jgi:hypothetical protein
MKTETNQTQDMNLEDKLRAVEFIANCRREELFEACRRAVECLERFAADARRELDRATAFKGLDLLELPGKVLSASAWGAANVSSELRSTSRIGVEYMNALGTLKALQMK